MLYTCSSLPILILNCVSSRETGAIRIGPLCIFEFPILPLKAAASVQAVPPTPHSLLLSLSHHKEV